ncbi:hypothetical protein ACSTJK_24575, partial [Vibrio parahaemolyticus]
LAVALIAAFPNLLTSPGSGRRATTASQHQETSDELPIASRPKGRYDRINCGLLPVRFAGLVRRLEYAVGATAQSDPAVGRR